MKPGPKPSVRCWKSKNAYGCSIAGDQHFSRAAPTTRWSGINELALMKKIDKWNEDAEVFGQLEATTAARYLNKQFVWETGGASSDISRRCPACSATRRGST